MKSLAALLAAPLLLAVAPPTSDVTVTVDGLRSDRGVVRVCLTRDPKAFPDCRADPDARRLTLTVAEAARIVFADVAPGRYAVALLHDENDNGRADTTLMVPREGFGFSRNPAIRFGPPRFARAAFEVGHGRVVQAIRMRYLL